MKTIISRIDGLDIIEAHNAEFGLDLARLENPDVIIMDINLPGMNGFDALNELRKLDVTRDTPVIALSANTTESDAKKGRGTGFQDYLTKPVDLNEIVQAIEKLVNDRCVSLI